MFIGEFKSFNPSLCVYIEASPLRQFVSLGNACDPFYRGHTHANIWTGISNQIISFLTRAGTLSLPTLDYLQASRHNTRTHTTNSFSKVHLRNQKTIVIPSVSTKSTLLSATAARSTPGENHVDKWLTPPSEPLITLPLRFSRAKATLSVATGGPLEPSCSNV